MSILRINKGGNYCGHDPQNPRFVSVINPYQDESWTVEARDSLGHKRKAEFFYLADEMLQQFYFYPKTLPALGLIEKSEKNRQRRSEAREDDARLLSALTHHMECASINWDAGFGRVGYPSKDGFIYYDTKWWVDKTGMSASQIKRSFVRLIKAGYVTRERRWIERKAGQFKALATMTVVHLSLFRDMGVIDALREFSAYARSRLSTMADKMQVSVSKMLRTAFDSILNNAKNKPSSLHVANPPAAKSVAAVLQGAKSTDFPPTDVRHWTRKLRTESEQTEFRRRYLDLMLEEGTDDPASIYRRAYESL